MPKSKRPNFLAGMLQDKKAYGYDVSGDIIDNGPTNMHDLKLLDTQPHPQEGTREPSAGTLEPKTKLYIGTTQTLWAMQSEEFSVTTDLKVAKTRAFDLADLERGGGIPIIAMIKFGNLENVDLKPDSEFALMYRDKSWQDSYRSKNTFLISGDIEPLKSRFTVVPLK